jgi:hypothetical protein
VAVAGWHIGGTLAGMSEPTPRRFGRFAARQPSLPSERDWEGSPVLEPRSASRHPELISDGSGLPFAPAALGEPAGQLDAGDPAVGVLMATIARQTKSSARSRVPWWRVDTSPKPAQATPSLDGWRVAARTDEEVLFARGHPPRLVTVAVRRDSKRGAWACLAVSTGRPLRATREGIRASGWRLDPTREPDPAQSELRLLITEQTWAGGMRADSRLLAPDLHVGAEELVLRVFVSPRPGFQVRSRNPETPARVLLPGPLGQRRVIDGALYEVA